ncbi:MAG: hypothetical protein WCU83_03000 [Bacteroidia bacterium]
MVTMQSVSAQSILSRDGVEYAYPRVSADDSKLLFQSNQTGKWQLYNMNLGDSSITTLWSDTFNNYFPDWNKDLSIVAFTSDRDSNENIFLFERHTGTIKRISWNKARNIHPYFSPDSKYILYSSTAGNGSLDIYRYELFSGETLRLTHTEEDETCARYSPQMNKIVYLKNGIVSDDIFVLDCSTFIADNITNDPIIRDGWPMFSPDGKWIYYSSMETGVFCIYRISVKTRQKVQLTYAGPAEEDARVFISSRSKRIFYNRRKGNALAIMARTME